MLCCLLAALVAGNFGLAGRAFASLAARRTFAAGLSLAVFAGSAAILSPVAMAHAGHYAERAKAHERSMLLEILISPICSGGGEAS